MRTIYLVLSGLILLIFTSACEKDTSPLGLTDGVHPDLVGNWVSVSQTSEDIPSVTGYEIDENGEIHLLAVETATGKLTRTGRAIGVILQSDNSRIKMDHYRFGFEPEIKDNNYIYTLENDQISFMQGDVNSYNRFGENIYYKNNIGAILVEPVESVFTADGGLRDIFENAQVANQPSAYAQHGKNLEPSFNIYAKTSDNLVLNIHFHQFFGEKTYFLSTTDSLQIDHYSTGGDVLNLISSNDGLSSGSVTISQYDTINNRCEGHFDFTLIADWGDSTRFTNGYFSVPIYQ